MKKALAFLMLMTGCANMTLEGSLKRQASYLENCPEEKIKILSLSPDHYNAEIDACGKVKRYQDRATYVDIDVTPRWTPLPKN